MFEVFQEWKSWITDVGFLESMKSVVFPTLGVMGVFAVVSYTTIKRKMGKQQKYASVNMGVVLFEFYRDYMECLKIIQISIKAPTSVNMKNAQQAKTKANKIVKEYNWYYKEALKYGRHQISPQLPVELLDWNTAIKGNRMMP